MKRTSKRKNGVRAADGAFFLRTFQAGFGYTAVFNTSNEAYQRPSIVLRSHRLASFTETC